MSRTQFTVLTRVEAKQAYVKRNLLQLDRDTRTLLDQYNTPSLADIDRLITRWTIVAREHASINPLLSNLVAVDDSTRRLLCLEHNCAACHLLFSKQILRAMREKIQQLTRDRHHGISSSTCSSDSAAAAAAAAAASANDRRRSTSV